MTEKQERYQQFAQDFTNAAILKRKDGVFYCEDFDDSKFWAAIRKRV